MARLDGGGESMNIGVGPEFMPLEEGFAADSFIDCPAIRSVTEYEAAGSGWSVVAYLRERMIGCSNYSEVVVAAMGAESERGHLPGLAVDAD